MASSDQTNMSTLEIAQEISAIYERLSRLEREKNIEWYAGAAIKKARTELHPAIGHQDRATGAAVRRGAVAA